MVPSMETVSVVLVIATRTRRAASMRVGIAVFVTAQFMP